MPIHKAYIGIGSNLKNPLQQVKTAMSILEQISINKEFQYSSIYKTTAMLKPGQSNQNDYFNAVVAIATNNSALALLDTLQGIENNQGRTKNNERWSARTLDLDILLFDDQIINHARLVVPHYGLRERNFVIYPLRDIDANLQLPDGTNISDLYQSCSTDGIRKIE